MGPKLSYPTELYTYCCVLASGCASVSSGELAPVSNDSSTESYSAPPQFKHTLPLSDSIGEMPHPAREQQVKTDEGGSVALSTGGTREPGAGNCETKQGARILALRAIS